MREDSLIVLSGPTAVGKTKLSIALAKAVGGEIISADSMQVYKYMDIGSAKIKPPQMQGIPHYLVDVQDPREEFHVVRFQQLAKEAMEEIRSHGHIPILVGGTGFYIQAVVYDISFTDSEKSPVRRLLEQEASEKGASWLHERLCKVDPESAAAIHENNLKKVIRALEFYDLTGQKLSAHNEEQRRKRSPYRFVYFVLNDRRERLYERIGQRVDEMLKMGLVEETARLRKMGCRRDMVSMQGLGYKELLAYLDGELTLAEAVETIKKDTRHFAKRQLTWFRREREVVWLDKEAYAYDEDRMLSHMLEILKEKGIIG